MEPGEYDNPTDRFFANIEEGYRELRFFFGLFMVVVALGAVGFALYGLFGDKVQAPDQNRTCIAGEVFTDGKAPDYWSDGSGDCRSTTSASAVAAPLVPAAGVVQAPPAPAASTFAGQRVSCRLWTYTVSRVNDGGGGSTISGRLTNRSDHTLYAENFSLTVDGDPDGLDAYVGGDIPAGGSEPLTFRDHGLLASLDGLSMSGGGGGAC